MNKIFIIFFCLIILVVIVYASSGGPPAARTGAPGEGNCTGCHSSFPVNSGSGTLTIIAPSNYIPGNTYPITVRLQQSAQSRWGFQITTLTAANQPAGTLLVTDAINTQKVVSTRQYIQQTSAGTFNGTANGPVEWQLSWQAPATNVGTITFYAAGNAANGNGSTSGDYIYTTSASAPAVLGSISGTKFHDLNGNGVYDAVIDGVLGNWRIILKKDGVLFDSLLTNTSGVYQFVNLTAANYEVSEVVQSGWVQTHPPVPGTHTIVLSQGQDATGRNFGNFQLGTISGIKFNDLNGNGVYEVVSDGLLENWRIVLRKNGVLYDSTFTNASGVYQFFNLPPGNYTVSEVVQGGWVQTHPSAPGTYAVTMTSGLNANGRNFGNFQPGTISGIKFDDLNRNGQKDEGESGLQNWEIRLRGPVNQTTQTGTDGNYTFTGLPEGQYSIKEILQSGWIQTKPVAPDSYSVNLAPGQNITGKDFGNARLGSITGYKWNDLNFDGMWNIDEPALPNWSIYLSGARTESTQTNSSGRYQFTNLDDGSYTVTEDTANCTQTYPHSPGKHNVEILHGTIFEGRSGYAEVPNFGNACPVSIVTVQIYSGWNMLSVPVTVDDYRKNILFPTAISSAFTYQGSYVIKDTLKNSVGYWLKFPSDMTLQLTGDRVDRDTFNVSAGWNMIGSISSPVPVSTITSDPSGIITSYFFKYDASSGYLTTDTVNPGIGYWVKVNQNGKLILTPSGAVFSTNKIRIVNDGEMPPSPPEIISIAGKIIPKEFVLNQNYPNPFNPTTTINYSLPTTSTVKLTIYDLLGREVVVLVDGIEDAGYKSVEWNAVNTLGSQLASGTYFYRLEATNINDFFNHFKEVRKMFLVQ